LTAQDNKESNVIWQSNVELLINRLGKERTSLLPSLESIQENLGFIPEDAVNYLGEIYKLPVTEIYSVITSYKMLDTEIKGKYLIKICDSLSCRINQSLNLIKSIRDILNIQPGETTPDNKFTLEVVDCLGACDQAPVMMVNKTIYGKLNKAKLKNILNDLQSKD